MVFWLLIYYYHADFFNFSSNADTEFQCKNFKCIPIANRCNGVIDCQDGNSTDEVGCPPIICNTTRLSVKCPNTNICIRRRWLCDGKHYLIKEYIPKILNSKLYKR